MSHNKQSLVSHINKPVFISSSILIVLFIIFAAALPQQTAATFIQIQQQIVMNFGWFYILAVAIVLIFCISVALSSYGQIKLGPDHIDPDFNYLTWFSMLFSAGMGIGLVFFGVGEPVMHYVLPPESEALTTEAAKQAMSITFFHWGLHAWAIYALVGLILAYYAYRHHLPLAIRSALFPIIGDKIYGFWGHIVDIAALLGTLFGIATSLGFGVVQINSGLHYLFDTPVNISTQLILIIITTTIATISATTGLYKGIRRLSELNLILALLLLSFILLLGPTVQLLQFFVQNLGEYLSSILSKTFNLYAYQQTGWIGGWTLFYWGWWIAWSPFVGMFIARISRGRTIREFILGVLFVPTGFTFIWMTVFGNYAIFLDMQTPGLLSTGIQQNVETAIFRLLEQLPLAKISSTLAILIVSVFFITSCDSGALVMDRLTTHGVPKKHHWQRIFWTSICGVVAALLLYAGGLEALQTAALASALPFVVIILIASYGLLRSLQLEKMRQIAFETSTNINLAPSHISWKKRLLHIINYPEKQKVLTFLKEDVLPALNNVKVELDKQGLETKLTSKPDKVVLMIHHSDDTHEYDFYYGVHLQDYLIPSYALTHLDVEEDDDEEEKYYRAEVHLTEGGQQYDIMGYTQEEIIADVLSQYDKHMQFLHFVSEKGS